MDANTWGAIVAAVIGLGALFYTRRAANDSGSTVAKEVRVTFEPLPELPLSGNSHAAEARGLLARGIASLPPGREMKWNLGVVHQLMVTGVIKKLTDKFDGSSA